MAQIDNYVPSQPPDQNDPVLSALATWMESELGQIASALQSTPMTKFNVLHVAPGKPRNGMVVYADGTDWDPGDGEGLYIREAGSWVHLTAPPAPSTPFPVSTTLRADGKSLWYNSAFATHVYAWASPTDCQANLIDFLDIDHGVGSWTGFSQPNSGTDVGPSVGNACVAMKNRWGGGRLIIPPGAYLSTAWDATKTSGVNIEGTGNSLQTQIWFDMAGGFGTEWNGYGGYGGGGVKHLALILTSTSGASSAYALGLTVSGSPGAYVAASNSYFDNLYIEGWGGSTWYRGVHIDAVLKVAPQGQGLRIGEMKNVQIFSTSNVAFYCRNAVQWLFDNIQSYGASGTDFYITGGGGTTENSTQIYMNGFVCSGNLNLSQCDHIQLHGQAASVSLDSTVTYAAGLVRTGSVSGVGGTATSNLIFY